MMQQAKLWQKKQRRRWAEGQKQGEKKPTKAKSQYQIVMRRKDVQDRLAPTLNCFPNINYRNFLFMNQEALKGIDNCYEPFMESVFSYKYGNKVELTEDYIRVNLEDRQVSTVPLQYIVERFRSFGDQRFYQIANALQKLDAIIDQISAIMAEHPEYFSEQAIAGILRQYQGKAYLAYHSTYVNKQLNMCSLILSRKLVQLLGYDPSDLAIKFTRVHAIKNFQIINTRMYPDIVSNYVQLMYQFHQMILKQGFSHQIWNSIAECERFLLSELYSAKKEKLSVQFKLNLHNPCFGVYEISRILGKVDNQFAPKRLGRSLSMLEDSKEDSSTFQQICTSAKMENVLIEQEQEALSKISRVPKTQLLVNQEKRCTYRPLEREQS